MTRLPFLFLLAFAALAAHAQDPASEVGDLEALLSEEVETAATHRRDAAEAAASVSVITADEIDRLGYRTLADILSTVRGLYVTDDRTYTYVGGRGFGRPSDYNQRIALFIDGVPLKNGFADSAPLGLVLGVPLSAIDRVEVRRGPGSTLYGTGAMFAVVNVVLKDTRTLDGVRTAATAGAYGSYGVEAFASTDLPGGVGVSLALHGLDEEGPDPAFAEFDSPATPGGVAEGIDYTQSYGAIAAVEGGPFRLDVRYGQRTEGIVVPAPFAAYGADAPSSDQSATATLRATVPLSPRVTASATAALDAYTTELKTPYDGLYFGVPGQVFSYTSTYGSTLARAGGQVQWSSAAHRVIAGVEALSQFRSTSRVVGDALQDTAFVTDDPFTAGSLFAQTESTVGDFLSVTLGGRLDAVRDYTAFSPRAAVVVTPDDKTSLKLIAGTAFRAPSSYEITYNAQAAGPLAPERLSPERVASIEAIARRQLVPGLDVEASVYRSTARQLIEFVALDQTFFTYGFDNAFEAYARGVEVGATAVTGGWRTRTSYAYQRVWNGVGDPVVPEEVPLPFEYFPGGPDTQLANAPHHVGKVTTFGPLGGGLWLAVDGRAESARRTFWGSETEPFAIFDAALSADVLSGLGRVTAGVRNVFDTEYAYPARGGQSLLTVPQRPRTIYLRLDARF